MIKELVIMRGTKSIKVPCSYDQMHYTDDEVDWAADSLAAMVQNRSFCKPGHRNDSVVDAMIYCHILGIDFNDLVDKCLYVGWVDDADADASYDKADIVLKYIDNWFSGSPADNRLYGVQKAKCYLIGTIK